MQVQYEAENPKPIIWHNPEGRDVERGGRGSRWGDMYTCSRFMLIYGKTITILSNYPIKIKLNLI